MQLIFPLQTGPRQPCLNRGCVPQTRLHASPRPAPQDRPKPLQDRILQTLLSTGSVPYSSYAAEPQGFLHHMPAIPKQGWLLLLLGSCARAGASAKAAFAGLVFVMTVTALPIKLWRPQLKRLAFLCGTLALFTVLGADGVPPVLQPRNLPASIEQLPDLGPSSYGYRFVLFHWGFITITRRSLRLALSLASLTFTALQAASLLLTTTPAESLALGLRTALQPLRLLGVPVQEITLTLLLSLRCLGLVFEDLRNLALGLAVRGMDWSQTNAVLVLARLAKQLFNKLIQRSESMALSLQARGFTDTCSHKLFTIARRQSPAVAMVSYTSLAAGCLLCFKLSSL